MSARVHVRPSGREFFVRGNDSLLEAALGAGLALDYGCSSGNCGKCRARVLSGEVQRIRHSDYALTAAEKAAGTVLLCCHTALGDVTIEAREAHGAADMPLQSLAARVRSVSALGGDMRLLHLQTPRSERLRFLAGQSVRLSLGDGTAAALPVASCPCDDRNLQFHVRAGEALAGVRVGDTVRIEGPSGEFVLDEASPRAPVFVAFDAGFAPVKSLLEHAMALERFAALHLCWIAAGPGGHYLDNLCRSWADALDNFHYRPATQPSELQRLLGELDLRSCDFYVAGPAPAAQAAAAALLERGLPAAQVRVLALQR